MAASRTRLGPPRPEPPSPGSPRPDALELELDADDDFDTAPPTPRANTQRGTGLSWQRPSERPSLSPVGTEFEIRQGDGRIDTTGLELQEIDDAVPTPPPNNEGLEVDLPTAWTHSQTSEEPQSEPDLRAAAPPPDKMEGIGEELDLGGIEPSTPAPEPDDEPAISGRAEDEEDRRRLDMGVTASSLVGVIDRAQKLPDAFAPPKERQFDIRDVRRVNVDVDAPQPSSAPPRPTPRPRVEPQELDLSASEDSSEQLGLTGHASEQRSSSPEKLGSGQELVLDTSALAPPEPLHGEPRPALRTRLDHPEGHTTALDLDAAAAYAGTVEIGHVDLRESTRPVAHGAKTAIGMHARAQPAPLATEAGLELQDPTFAVEQANLDVASPDIVVPPIHDSIVPELEVEVRASSGPPPRTSSRPPPTDIQPGTGIRELAIEESDARAPELDLAEPIRHSPPPAGATHRRRTPPRSSFDPDFDDSYDDRPSAEPLEVAAAPRGASHLAPNGKAAPSGRTPDTADLAISPDQVELVADYGEASRNALLSPLYTLRVHRRRRALKADLARMRKTLQQAELDRDTELAEIFVRHRDKLQTQQNLDGALGAVRGTEADHETIKQEFAEVSAEYQQRQRELRIRREHADQVARARQQAEDARREILHKCEDDYNRVALRFKRLQIELRNIENQERQRPDGAVPIDVQDKRARQWAAKKRSVTLALNKLVPQAQRLRSIMESAAKELETTERETRKASGQLKVIEAERRALDSWYAKQTAGYGKSVTDAEAAYVTATADVVRAALSVGATELDGRTLDKLREHDRHVRDLAFGAHRLLLALDAYDPDSYRQGFVTGLSLVAALVLMIVVFLLFR